MRYRAVLRWTGLLLFLLGLVACRRLPSPDPIVDRLAQEGIVETPTMTRTLAASSSTTIVAATSTPESSVTPVFTPSPTLTPIPTLTATPAPPPPELPFFGVQLVRFSSSQIDRITQAGAYLTRFDRFHWDRIEPVRTDPPSYNWTAVDEIGLQRLVDNDVQMIGVIQFTPFWAQKIQGYACGPIKEDALEAFGQFMNALVTRYGGPPYNIRYWEIGNEPDVWHTQVTGRNQFGCWGDSETPYFGGEYYGQMLRTVYPQVKAADPEAQVLVGGLLLDCDPDNPPESPPGSGQLKDCSSTKFLEGILNSGAGPYFDGVSFHAYDYYYQDFGYFGNVDWDSGYLLSDLYPVLRKKAQFLENLLNRYGHPDKYLVNSESSLLCGSGKEGFCFSQDFSRAKAAYAAQTLATSLAMDFHAYIWYSLDASWRATDLEGEAYQAFQFATSQLGGATFQGPVTGYQELVGYRFSRDDGELWVVWSGDAEPHSFPLPEGTATTYNMFGAPLDHSSFIEVDFSPVYLEFSP